MPSKKPKPAKVKVPKAVKAEVFPCNEGYGNCWERRCRYCRAAMKRAVAGAKPVKSFGLVTSRGRLINEAMRKRKDWDMSRGPGETVIPVTITPTKPTRRKT